jgi:hypothetical protein
MIWLLVLALAQTAAIDTIAQGDMSEIMTARDAVARTPAEWSALWTSHGGEGAPAAVDFSTQMVAAVFLGSRPTGGHRVDIVSTRRDGETLVVEYLERAPGRGDIAIQVLTAPFHVVRLPRHAGPVRFERRAKP